MNVETLPAPVSGHLPVLLNEAVEGLAIRPNGAYLDGTFGRGGHTRRILDCLGPQGRLWALDRDPQAIEAARAIVDPRLRVVHSAFSALDEVLMNQAVPPLDGILLDLGVSSPQIDQAWRGFSFRADGPLDMRMDPSTGVPLSIWLAEVTEAGLATVIRDLGEERFARQVARAIVRERQQHPIETTAHLARIVASAVRTREPGQDPATRTFQALRLQINGELEELRQVLPQALKHLGMGGRLVVISFHSLEDRIVKTFIRTHSQPPEIPPGWAVREVDRQRPPLRRVGKPVRAGAAEILANPRSRSAILRMAERVAS